MLATPSKEFDTSVTLHLEALPTGDYNESGLEKFKVLTRLSFFLTLPNSAVYTATFTLNQLAHLQEMKRNSWGGWSLATACHLTLKPTIKRWRVHGRQDATAWNRTPTLIPFTLPSSTSRIFGHMGETLKECCWRVPSIGWQKTNECNVV